MKYEIIVTVFKKDEICSIDDQMIINYSIQLEDNNAKNCIQEIGEIIEKNRSVK